MDLLRLPLAGPSLPPARRALQAVLLAVAIAVVVHGVLGSPVAPRNLATVLTAVHWRGLLILSLLAVGNLFCMACPMMLVRDGARRFVNPTRRWPRVLRRKWIGLALLVAVIVSYELFNIWTLPRATAWIVVAYFATALIVDLTFTGASFCKYVCPIGQFNFVASTVSPTELQVRELATCRACRTSDCIKGRRDAAEPLRIQQRGCELGLFLPMKVGNLDCTLCMDCVRACPHDNIALTTRVPAVEWLDGRHRSGIGRLVRRADLAALVVVFAAAAPVTAFVMTAPGHTLVRETLVFGGRLSEAAALALLCVAGLVLIPSVVLPAATVATRALTSRPGSLRTVMVPFVFGFVPFAFGGWLAHYSFHLLTGALTIVPVTQSAAIDLFGTAMLGEPLWQLTGVRPGLVAPLQFGFVLLGSGGSLGLIRSVAEREFPDTPMRAALPWIVILLAVTAIALWTFAQPMDMRGVSWFR